MRRLPPLLAVVPLLLAACGGGGGSAAGTNPGSNTNLRLVTKPLKRAIVVHLKGKEPGVATLRRAGAGQKTSVEVNLGGGAPGGAATVELARGSCGRPTGLTRPTVLGQMHGSHATWTVPSPYAQLANGPLAVVVRTAQHAIDACGNAPTG